MNYNQLPYGSAPDYYCRRSIGRGKRAPGYPAASPGKAEGYGNTGEAGVADDYISNFLSKQKEKSEKQKLEWEEAARATQIVLQEKVQVETQAPAVWAELIEFIRQTISQINAANGNDVIALQTPNPQQLDLQCGVKFLKLNFIAETQVIQVDASFATRRRWKTLHGVVDGEQVRFAENTSHGFKPLTSDEILKGLLSSFVA
jgi:hypothetical protein